MFSARWLAPCVCASLVACSRPPATDGEGKGGSGPSSGGTSASSGGMSASSGGSATGGVSSGGASTGGVAGGASGSAGGGGASAGGSGGGTPSSGCGSTTGPASGTFTMDVDGTEREYILTLPDNYDPSHAYPVIFGWHPLGGDMQGVAEDGFGFLGGYYGLREQANDTVIFVAANGLPNDMGNRGWPNTNGRDIAFLEAMLARFRSELCIDESRLLSTGFSFGGMMSDLIACQLGQTFRAIAPMAGTLITSYNTCVNEPVPALIIHGDVDQAVDVTGGAQFRDYLLETNGCDAASMPVEPSPCVAYAGCDAGYPVSWCEFAGDHTVPDFASQAIWDFFSQFL
jgi:poly(3-hydroxybutyrate) depolymerase